MKNILLILALMLAAAGLSAQEAIPSGTILPVQLNSALRSDKSKPGEKISARIMQDVPLSNGGKVRAGSKVLGRVTAVQQAGKGAEIALRFDKLMIGNRRSIPVTTDLRAVATMLDVSDAQVPESGPDRGTPQYSWTTDLIGGEVDYGGGNPVTHGSYVVGESVPPGVLVHVSSTPGTKCRGEVDHNDRLQALWVFSSDACGVYGFRDLAISHAGRTAPVGEVALHTEKGNVNIRAGSGLLLRVNNNVP
jgi:hypothetical protein